MVNKQFLIKYSFSRLAGAIMGACECVREGSYAIIGAYMHTIHSLMYAIRYFCSYSQTRFNNIHFTEGTSLIGNAIILLVLPYFLGSHLFGLTQPTFKSTFAQAFNSFYLTTFVTLPGFLHFRTF